jgi:ATP-dependent exoDNAse (exonuclease V) beta subunit
MIIELQQAFKHIQYFDFEHIYIDVTTGERLPSVTGHIKKFQPEFNEKYWLGEKAKQRGITPEELKKEWLWLSKIGVEMGSHLHSFLEQKIQRRHIVPTIPDYLDKDKFEILVKQAEDYVETISETIVACEFVMCNLDNTLAGMCDRLSLSDNNKLIISDYKTGQLKDSYGKYHNKPYGTLEASSVGKYSLQLNHYRDFLESRGFEVERMEIVWFNENNPTFQIIEIPKIEII